MPGGKPQSLNLVTMTLTDCQFKVVFVSCSKLRRKLGIWVAEHHRFESDSSNRFDSELMQKLNCSIPQSLPYHLTLRRKLRNENAHLMLAKLCYNARCDETYLSQCSSVSACFQASTPPETPCSSTVQCPLLTFINQFSKIAVSLGPWRRV